MAAPLQRLLEWVHELPLRVASKFALAFTVFAFVSAVAGAGIVAAREASRLERNVAVDLQDQIATLAPLLTEVGQREGEARARELLGLADDAHRLIKMQVVDPATALSERPERGTGSVTVSAPLGFSSGGRMLVLSRRLPPVTTLFVDELLVALPATALVIALLVATAFALGHGLVGVPLRRVSEQTRRIAEGDFTRRLAVRGSVEIVALKREINAMSYALFEARARADAEVRARQEATDRLRHADRLKTVGTLTAGLAHELGTPLNVLFLEARAIERHAADTARVVSAGKVVREQVERMTRIVRQLLGFARRRQPTCDPGDLATVVAQAVELVRPLARSRGITVDLVSEDAPARFEVGAIEQVVTNLLVNAFDASAEGQSVRIHVATVERSRPGDATSSSSRWSTLSVEDAGTGMDEETVTRVFEPFFTTKDVGRGTGLGLSVVLGIVEDHGGFVEIDSAIGRGSHFTIHLPYDREPARAPESALTRTPGEVALPA